MAFSHRLATLAAVVAIPLGIAATSYTLTDSAETPKVPSRVELESTPPESGRPSARSTPTPTTTPSGTPGTTPSDAVVPGPTATDDDSDDDGDGGRDLDRDRERDDEPGEKD